MRSFPRPEYGEKIHSTDRGSQVAGDGLDIVEQLTALASLHHSFEFSMGVNMMVKPICIKRIHVPV